MEKETLKAYVITELTAELAVEDMESEYGEDDYAELDGHDLTDYESSIRECIEKEKESLDDGGNLAPYIDESLLGLRENVLRIEPDVVVYEEKLCGCAIVELKQELSERDWNSLLDYISGQYSDGWGEGFEQRDIPVADGILNVHFWQPDQKYPIVLDALSGQVPTVPQQAQKPRMRLIGQDGNIFSILGRASRLLRQNGQGKQAEEMFRRVQESGDYSGNFIAQAEVDQIDTLRFVMGIAPQNFSWELKPGASFQAPEVLLCFSDYGFDALSNRLNGFQMQHLVRGKYRTERCPILVNNWEATYFDFDEERLLALAREAKEVGIEMLVLDDGWFGERNDDTTSLGDWFVNRQKLPDGLAGFGAKLRALGLQFGLWFEPEMVSPISCLMEQHPDWCLHIPGRENVTSRSQCVLDMGLSAVQEYLFERMSGLIREAKLAYIKWDMNRSITNARSMALPPHRQGEVWHRYILGVYALLERLLNAFPQLLIESCASGGGRYDAGMLYYSPQVWASDNTDAVDRLKIQYGNSFGFPMKTMGSHVSVCPNHQTGRTAPLETRALTAMCGSFGYEMDLTQLSDAEKKQIKAQIELFKHQWQLHQLGEYHRLTDAQNDRWFTAWQVVSEDKSVALVQLVLLAPRANAPVLSVRLRGLQEDAVYEDDGGTRYTGAALMKAGLALPPMRGDYSSIQIEFQRLL